MIKYIFIALLSLIFTFPAVADENEPSLIDLFGEEEKKEQVEKEREAPDLFSKAAKEETKKAESEEVKEEVDEKGMFSFLNFSFLRDKDKAKEFTRKDDEPKESYEERMTRLADEGDVDACLTLGYMYLYGEGGMQSDSEKAFKYYSMAADKGDKIAMNNLGSLYYSGIGTKKDVRQAIKLFDEAAKLWNTEAAVNLAFIYLTSGATDNPTVKSAVVKLFNQAANGDNITAQYMMGMIYYNGFGITKNDDKAFQMLRMAASQYDRF